MRRGILATVIAVAVLAVGFALIRNGLFDDKPMPTVSATPDSRASASLSPSVSPTRTPTTPPVQTPSPSATPIDTSVVADGVVVPPRSAELAMRVSGVVDAIFVREGGAAAAGQLLLTLDQSTYEAAIDSAESVVRRATAAVEQAQLQVDQLPPDASPSQIGTVQANLRLAQAELEVARRTLSEAENTLLQTEVRAPFAGTIAEVAVEVGEQAMAGQPVVTIGDFSTWLIETTNLSELEIVRIGVGDRTTLTFEALPDLVIGGTVDHIQLRGTSAGGTTVFAVTIRPDVTDPRLRWGMTATVRMAPTR